MRFALLIVFCVIGLSVQAGVISYNIDRNGNVLGSLENIRYYGDYQDGYWALDDLNNTIRSSNGGTTTLKTSLFSVSDIRNVTYSNINSNMWVDIGGPIHYSIDRSGNVNYSSSNIRYFGDYQDGYWILDDLNNTIRPSNGGATTLKTSLFSVSDIRNVTYSNINNNMWVDIGGPVHYSIDRSGNINGTSNNLRYFGDYQDGYWVLDDLNNTIGTSFGGFTSLKTSLFSVSDILDVTYSNIYNHMWVTVEKADPKNVSEPSMVALLGLSIAGLGFVRRRASR